MAKLGRFRFYTSRTSSEAFPMLMIYPLIGRKMGPGVLITVWRHRLEVRW